MVKQSFLILILILFTGFANLWAEVEEMPELETGILQDNWINKLYEELNYGTNNLSVNSRFRWTEDTSNALLSLQAKEGDLRFIGNLYSADDEHLMGNFLLSRITPKNELKEIHLGSMRPGWGLGTVLRKSSAINELYKVDKSPHPLYASPLGASVIVSQNDFYLFLLASQAERHASLQDDKISYIYARRYDDLKYVTERIVSGGLEYRQPTFALGGMAYWQGYDRSFTNPAYNRDLEAISLAGSLKGDTAQFACEGALIEGDGAVQALLGITLPRLEQSIGVSYRKNLQLPAYAAKPFLLSNSGGHEELTYKLDFPATANLNIGLAHALLRNLNSLNSASWWSRSIFSITYKPESTRVHAQITRLDKEVVSQTDSTYVSTLPTHLRGKIEINQDINRNFALKVLFRYHYEDKLKSENNSFFWENALTWNYKALTIEGGLQSWQSLHSIIRTEDELSDPDGIMVATNEDNQAFAGLKFRWRSIHLNAQVYQSWLNGERSMYLGVGI